MEILGKTLILVGIVIIVLGVCIFAVSHIFGGRGTLPGDIVIRRSNVVIYFPIVSSIVVSIILTLIMLVVAHFRR